MAFDRKAYMREYNKRPEVVARRKANTKKWNEGERGRQMNSEKQARLRSTVEGRIYFWSADLKNKYGIDGEEYDRLFDQQDGRCLICDEPGESSKPQTAEPQGKNPKALCVDHCHETNIVRGLLCGHCNKLLGFAKDDTEILLRAIEYLEIRKEVSSGS